MADTDMLGRLKFLIGEDVQDDRLLSAYLDLSGRAILDRAYPYSSEMQQVPERYQSLQLEIALYLWNKRGAEGQTSHSENGISRSYGSADIPKEMLSRIVPHVGVLS